MTQTRPTHQPISIFEERIQAAMMGAANMASFVAGNHAIHELLAYEAEHRRAAGPLYAGTNALVRFFTDDRAPVLALRRAVIDVARHLPPVRAAITRRLVDAAA